MQFTQNELIFLNSITGGGELFGFPIHFPAGEKRKQAIEVTIRALRQKNILNAENRLSILGGTCAKALKEYRKAGKHLIFNYLHAALINDEKAVLLLPAAREYDLYTVPIAVLAGVLLKRCPAGMCEPPERQPPIHMGKDEMLKKIGDAEDSILYGSFCGQKTEQEKIYYCKDKKLYEYDFAKEALIWISGRDLRNKLVQELLPWHEGNPGGKIEPEGCG